MSPTSKLKTDGITVRKRSRNGRLVTRTMIVSTNEQGALFIGWSSGPSLHRKKGKRFAVASLVELRPVSLIEFVLEFQGQRSVAIVADSPMHCEELKRVFVEALFGDDVASYTKSFVQP